MNYTFDNMLYFTDNMVLDYVIGVFYYWKEYKLCNEWFYGTTGLCCTDFIMLYEYPYKKTYFIIIWCNKQKYFFVYKKWVEFSFGLVWGNF